jgi:hypothetical protein
MAARSGSASPVPPPAAMTSSRMPWRAPRITEMTLLKAICTWPAASAGSPAGPARGGRGVDLHALGGKEALGDAHLQRGGVDEWNGA